MRSTRSNLQKKEDAFQRATMLYCLGPAVQRIFNTLPGEHKSLGEAKTALNGYFAPKRNVVVERYEFRSRAQKADESFDAYLTSPRELVKSCDFGTLEEKITRDQTVEKCSSQTLKQKLLQQEDLDLAKTVKIARNAETAVQEDCAIAFSRHQRKPDPYRPCTRFLRITSKNFQLLPMWWNRRTCS